MSTSTESLDLIGLARAALREAEAAELAAANALRQARLATRHAKERLADAIDEALDARRQPRIPFEEAAEPARTPAAFDPLSIACPMCDAAAGSGCRTTKGKAKSVCLARQHPKPAPAADAEAPVAVGNVIRTRYGTGPFVVTHVSKRGQLYSVTMRDQKPEKGTRATDLYINDIARQPDGRITSLKDKDELVVLPPGSDGGPTFFDWCGRVNPPDAVRKQLLALWFKGEPFPEQVAAKPAEGPAHRILGKDVVGVSPATLDRAYAGGEISFDAKKEKGKKSAKKVATPAAPVCGRPGECRVCECTEADCSGCVARTGAPCSWVDADRTLCSACLPLVESDLSILFVGRDAIPDRGTVTRLDAAGVRTVGHVLALDPDKPPKGLTEDKVEELKGAAEKWCDRQIEEGVALAKGAEVASPVAGAVACVPLVEVPGLSANVLKKLAKAGIATIGRLWEWTEEEGALDGGMADGNGVGLMSAIQGAGIGRQEASKAGDAIYAFLKKHGCDPRQPHGHGARVKLPDPRPAEDTHPEPEIDRALRAALTQGDGPDNSFNWPERIAEVVEPLGATDRYLLGLIESAFGDSAKVGTATTRPEGTPYHWVGRPNGERFKPAFWFGVSSHNCPPTLAGDDLLAAVRRLYGVPKVERPEREEAPPKKAKGRKAAELPVTKAVGELPLEDIDGFPTNVARALAGRRVVTLADLERRVEEYRAGKRDLALPSAIYDLITSVAGFSGYLATTARTAVMKHLGHSPDCGTGSAECGVEIRNPKSEIRNSSGDFLLFTDVANFPREAAEKLNGRGLVMLAHLVPHIEREQTRGVGGPIANALRSLGLEGALLWQANDALIDHYGPDRWPGVPQHTEPPADRTHVWEQRCARDDVPNVAGQDSARMRRQIAEYRERDRFGAIAWNQWCEFDIELPGGGHARVVSKPEWNGIAHLHHVEWWSDRLSPTGYWSETADWVMGRVPLGDWCREHAAARVKEYDRERQAKDAPKPPAEKPAKKGRKKEAAK
jgi:hypothetical protein